MYMCIINVYYANLTNVLVIFSSDDESIFLAQKICINKGFIQIVAR